MRSLVHRVISATRPTPRILYHDLRHSCSNQDNVSIKAEGLWDELERRMSLNWINHLRTLLLGFDSKELEHTLHVFGLLDIGMTASISDLSALRGPADLWNLFDVVIINHDAFEDPETAVEEYLAFRQRFEDKTVLLVSRCVGKDDLSTERAAISDATLRFPLSSERLLLGLRAAESNRKAKLTGKAT